MTTKRAGVQWLLGLGLWGCAGPAEPTYWKDVGPVLSAKCGGCHAAGGVGAEHFELTAAAASARAEQIDALTQRGEMPPYAVAHDGSCGDFDAPETLTEAELDLIHRWASGRRLLGDAPAGAKSPEAPVLAGAFEVQTPPMVPQVDPHHPLGPQDEYRCYLAEPGLTEARFITAYQVTPGNKAIVHHVTGFVVAPGDPSRVAGKSNGELMAAYDAMSPDRAGWECFGLVGDGVDIKSFPVTWGPGQDLVEFPAGVGVPVAPTDRLVFQVHYNVHHVSGTPAPDSTRVRLRYAPSVKRPAISFSYDAFLMSLILNPMSPDTLPPGVEAHVYSTTRTREQMFLPPTLPPLEVLGVMPHMHERGRKFELRFKTGAADECVARIDRWSFHHQRMYWFRTRPVLGASTAMETRCTFDTRDTSRPVRPGWSTDNEMCTATMLLVPPEAP